MRSILVLLFCSVSFLSAMGQQGSSKVAVPDSAKKTEVVEASCGECNFKMEGNGCHLAVRIKGKSYFVDGTAIDEHGDAHASDGFCEKIRKAEVQGEIVNNRFKVTYFKLLKEEKKTD